MLARGAQTASSSPPEPGQCLPKAEASPRLDVGSSMVLCPLQPQTPIENVQYAVCLWRLGETKKEMAQSRRTKWPAGKRGRSRAEATVWSGDNSEPG